MKITDKHVFFWGGVLSNWYTVPGKIVYVPEASFGYYYLEFRTSEHLFMYLKAMYFGDKETAEEIKSAPDPKTAKRLGRKVKGFDETEWEKYREVAMMKALRAKAKYFEPFRKEILREEYSGKNFVEASPYDKVWGIGMAEDDPNLEHEESWGLNLLGKCLNRLRDELQQ